MQLDRIIDKVHESYVESCDIKDLMDVLKTGDIDEIKKLNGDRKYHLMWLIGMILNTDPVLKEQAQLLSDHLFCKDTHGTQPSGRETQSPQKTTQTRGC